MPWKCKDDPLPSVVNGWFFVCHGSELAAGTVKHFVAEGEHIAVFRGTDRQLYAIDAYCGHLGANMAEGGQVVNRTCLRCPFHGWLYDGRTGACVNHDGSAKTVTQHRYESASEEIHIREDSCRQQTANRTFRVLESADNVYVWVSATE
jgi:cholesterol 7-dehydrogenase